MVFLQLRSKYYSNNLIWVNTTSTNVVFWRLKLFYRIASCSFSRGCLKKSRQLFCLKIQLGNQKPKLSSQNFQNLCSGRNDLIHGKWLSESAPIWFIFWTPISQLKNLIWIQWTEISVTFKKNWISGTRFDYNGKTSKGPMHNMHLTDKQCWLL